MRIDALVSPQTSSRQNAAWALGMMHAVASPLLSLLKSGDPVELKEILLALSRCPGEVPARSLLPFLSSSVPTVRAAAALALASHQPEVAATAVPNLLHVDEQQSAAECAKYVTRGKPKLTQAEIDPIVEEFREHMKLIHAIETLPPRSALPLLTPEAFRSAEDPSHVTARRTWTAGSHRSRSRSRDLGARFTRCRSSRPSRMDPCQSQRLCSSDRARGPPRSSLRSERSPYLRLGMAGTQRSTSVTERPAKIRPIGSRPHSMGHRKDRNALISAMSMRDHILSAFVSEPAAAVAPRLALLPSEAKCVMKSAIASAAKSVLRLPSLFAHYFG